MTRNWTSKSAANEVSCPCRIGGGRLGSHAPGLCGIARRCRWNGEARGYRRAAGLPHSISGGGVHEVPVETAQKTTKFG